MIPHDQYVQWGELQVLAQWLEAMANDLSEMKKEVSELIGRLDQSEGEFFDRLGRMDGN